MSNHSNRVAFWSIWGIAVLPMLAAAFMYYSGALNPVNTVNQGELVENQTLTQWQLEYHNRAWRPTKQWQILHTQPNQCSSAYCKHWSDTLPSVIKLLGRDSDRVVLHQVGSVPTMLNSRKISQLGEAVWIVDPLGNVVMRYAPKLAPEQLLKDLKKLLKISGIG